MRAVLHDAARVHPPAARRRGAGAATVAAARARLAHAVPRRRTRRARAPTSYRSRSTSASAAATSKRCARSAGRRARLSPTTTRVDTRAGGRRQPDVRAAGVSGRGRHRPAHRHPPRSKSVRSAATSPGRGPVPHRRRRRRHPPGADRPGAASRSSITRMRQFPFRPMTIVGARPRHRGRRHRPAHRAARARSDAAARATSRRWTSASAPRRPRRGC